MEHGILTPMEWEIYMEQRRIQTTECQWFSLDSQWKCEKSLITDRWGVRSLIWKRWVSDISAGQNWRWKTEKSSSEFGAAALWDCFREKKGPAMWAPVKCKMRNLILSMLDEEQGCKLFENFTEISVKIIGPKIGNPPNGFSQRLKLVDPWSLSRIH